MVFAVWAAPEPADPSLLELEDALVASVRAARADPETLAFEAAERYGYPAGYLARYFEKLRYRFGPRERAGLYTFLELARDVGELDEVPGAALRHRGGTGLMASDGARSSRRLSTASESPTVRRSHCSSHATSSRSDGPRTSFAPAAPIRRGSPSSSTGTSTTRTSA